MINETLKKIQNMDASLLQQAQTRLDSLTKPKDSLGRLEEFAKRLVTITGNTMPDVQKKVVFTFAGDHGVAEEGVSAFPKEVTREMVLNFINGGAAINVLARHAGADVVVVDIGVDYDFAEHFQSHSTYMVSPLSPLKTNPLLPPFTKGGRGGIIKKGGLFISNKVIHGTKNIAKGPAMTRNEAEQCIQIGIDLANAYVEQGYRMFGTGDMGIANTTPSSAIGAVLTGRPVKDVTGRGTGIDEQGLRKKVQTIEQAIALNNPDPNDPVDVLAKVGGAEIGGIAGLILGCASQKVPVVVDGLISTAGALIAYCIEPKTKDFMFAAHNSVEIGHKAMLDKMGLKPILDLNLRLGEGTGAVLAMSIIEAGLKIYKEMATFGEAGVSK